jgi:hypothetical protein
MLTILCSRLKSGSWSLLYQLIRITDETRMTYHVTDGKIGGIAIDDEIRLPIKTILYLFFFTFKQSIAKNTLFKCVYNLHEEILLCLIVDYFFSNMTTNVLL